ncbi:hypothetical protein LT493_44640 [Streptomyces tricolor]|nr:hypothetical protein [Streptomyces tricolor]
MRLAHAHHDLVAADPGEGRRSRRSRPGGTSTPGPLRPLYRDTYRRAPHETLAGG